jgi:putative ABC transport system permease protein
MNRILDQVLDRQAGSGLDLQVGAAAALDPGVVQQVAAVPGVSAVTPKRFGQAEFLRPDGTTATVPLQVVDPASYFDVSGYLWADGSDQRARDSLGAGGNLLLPDTTAQNMGLHTGRTVNVRTSAGVRSFRLAATYESIGTGSGAVVGVRDLDLFGSGRPNSLGVRVASPQQVRPVEARIASALAAYRPFISSAADVRAQARSQIRGFYSIGYVLLGMAGLIGVLGLANTLVVSVLSRTREIGILRSTGFLRRQVRRMVLVEAEVLALVALVLSLPLAGLLAEGLIAGQRSGLGFSVSFQYPWSLLPPVTLIAVAVAALASLLPGRRAARLEPVAALRFE